jgi:ATP/maltotriose-dependent transcriptional regulator MalT
MIALKHQASEPGEVNMSGRAMRGVRIPCPQFIGRREELSWLQERLHGACNGRGGLVLVAGEAGVGKTRLINEVVDRHRRPEIRILEGRCSPFETELSYGPFVEAFRGLTRSLTPPGIRTLLGPYASEVSKLLPEVSQALPELQPNPPLSPPEEKSRLFESLYLLLHRLAAERPLIVTLEDLHWGDPASLELLGFLSYRIRADRALVLATFRLEELPRAEMLRRLREELTRTREAEELTLRPLGPLETDELLEEVFAGVVPTTEELRAWIYHSSEGNPFYTEEIVRSLVDSVGPVDHLDAGVLSRVPVPPSLRDAVLARLQQLTPSARDVLRTAAVLGRTFPLEPLQEITGLQGDLFTTPFTSLLTTQFIRLERAPQQYGFRHHLIREVVLQHLPPDVRRALHSRVGEYLEKRSAPPSSPQVLAYHFGEAADPERTVENALTAARQAAAVYAHDEAARYFRIVLVALPAHAADRRLAVAEGLGDALQYAGRFEQAVGAYETMSDCAKTLEQRTVMARAYRKIAAAQNRRTPGSGHASLEAGLGLLAGVDDPEESAQILAGLATEAYETGRYEDAVAHARSAVETIERSERASTRSYCLKMGLAEFLFTLWGAVGDAPRFHEEVLARARQAGDFSTELKALNHAGYMALLRGDFGPARQYLEQGRALSDRIGITPNFLAVSLAELSVLEGRWDDAEMLASQARTQLTGNTQNRSYAWATMVAGVVSVHRGRYDEAGQRLNEARISAGPDLYAGALISTALARLELARGNAGQARGILEHARTQIAATGLSGHPKAELIVALAEVMLQQDDLEAGRKLLEASTRSLELFPYLRPALRRIQGQLMVQAESLDAGIGHMERALSGPEPATQPYQEALLRLHLGVCLLRRSRPGDRKKARAQLTEALAVLRRLGAQPDAERAQRALDRIGGRKPSAGMLTEREQEILTLLSRGFSNPAIAAHLFISPRTVEAHVSHILSKLNVHNRGEAIAWAAQRHKSSLTAH